MALQVYEQMIEAGTKYPGFFTVGELAKALGVTPNSIRTWTLDGHFPGAISSPKKTANCRYPYSVVKAHILAHTVDENGATPAHAVPTVSEAGRSPLSRGRRSREPTVSEAERKNFTRYAGPISPAPTVSEAAEELLARRQNIDKADG